MDKRDYGKAASMHAFGERPAALVICEHASNRVPEFLQGLGLDAQALESHIAWDPGALAVSRYLAEGMQACLVQGHISRLVYDCNRPPRAASAMPEQSEIHIIPGNLDLGPQARAERVRCVYDPFCNTVSGAIEQNRETLALIVTIHSFTPVFHGRPRAVEIGVLHGQDDRFAKAMMQSIPENAGFDIRLNAPYSAQDGVAHTLDLHGAANGLPNVMIELRNDLIQTPQQQEKAAAFLLGWIRKTMQSEVTL